MTEKRRCPNCGAYISARDKICYVCGKDILSAGQSGKASPKKNNRVVFEPERDKDFVMPVDHDEVSDTPFEERRAYTDNYVVQADYDDNYENDPFVERDVEPYFYDDSYDSGKGPDKKKIAVIGAVAVAVVAVIVLIVCFVNGVFGSGAPGDEITVYFDKPSVNINLMDDNGVVYNWGADVTVNYKHNGKEEEQSAAPSEEHNNMWKCSIPSDATDLYFSQTTGDEIRTVNAKIIENDTVYYVTDILLNSDNQLPMSSCKLADFDNLGVNAIEETESTKAKTETTAPDTEADTEEETDEETEPETETEKPTEALDNPYNISIPSSWSSGTTKTENDNCVTYYEKYNFNNYGNGMLLSIYTFKAGDNSYGDLNAKKILTASDGSKIVIVTPTDLECDDSDEKAVQKYVDLQKQTSAVISSISAN